MATHLPPAPAATTAGDATLRPWSCTNCRRRKLRCDRAAPCSNCAAKDEGECIFPVSGRLPRRKHDPNLPLRNRQIQDALRARVASLEAQVGDVAKQHALQLQRQKNHNKHAGEDILPLDFLTGDLDDKITITLTRKGVGKLFVSETRSLYIGEPIWTTLCRVETIQDSLGDSFNRIQTKPASSLHSPCDDTTFWPFASTVLTPEPDTSQRFPFLPELSRLWKTYADRIDPLIKLLHIPTTSNLVCSFQNDGGTSAKPGVEALMFAICSAAVATMTEEEVQPVFQLNKIKVFNRFRNGAEQALKKANFPDTSDMAAVQAAAIYVLAVRSSHAATHRSMWTFMGMLTRLAVSIGLHRDPSNFPGISSFEAEMRRRLWWTICIIDWQCGDTQFTDMSLSEAMFDTRVPANVDDDEIYPEMSESPKDRDIPSDISVFLFFCDSWRLNCRLEQALEKQASEDPKVKLPSQIKAFRKAEDLFREKYFVPFQSSRLVHQFGKRMGEIMFAKAIVRLHYDTLFDKIANTSTQSDDLLFNSAMDVLKHEYGTQTDSLDNPTWSRWSWLPRAVIPWHSMAAILLRLLKVLGGNDNLIWSEAYDRAWELVQKSVSAVPCSSRDGPFFSTIQSLVNQVQMARCSSSRYRLPNIYQPGVHPTVQPSAAAASRIGFQHSPVPYSINSEILSSKCTGLSSFDNKTSPFLWYEASEPTHPVLRPSDLSVSLLPRQFTSSGLSTQYPHLGRRQYERTVSAVNNLPVPDMVPWMDLEWGQNEDLPS
ncbi:hypothetical protein GQ53DRAFT_835185 [Thozetella sp. PMI_491]|nr:hypothetical protein GQ53DRAFT_835185 [Thozetella sp. PMI_491]